MQKGNRFHQVLVKYIDFMNGVLCYEDIQVSMHPSYAMGNVGVLLHIKELGLYGFYIVSHNGTGLKLACKPPGYE